MLNYYINFKENVTHLGILPMSTIDMLRIYQVPYYYIYLRINTGTHGLVSYSYRSFFTYLYLFLNVSLSPSLFLSVSPMVTSAQVNLGQIILIQVEWLSRARGSGPITTTTTTTITPHMSPVRPMWLWLW